MALLSAQAGSFTRNTGGGGDAGVVTVPTVKDIAALSTKELDALARAQDEQLRRTQLVQVGSTSFSRQYAGRYRRVRRSESRVLLWVYDIAVCAFFFCVYVCACSRMPTGHLRRSVDCSTAWTPPSAGKTKK